MYGIPSSFDGQFFKGLFLEMLSFNANQIYLHFNKNVSLAVEGEYAYYQKGSHAVQKIKPSVTESNLMELLEQSVKDVSWTTDGTLKLLFENDYVFECFDSSKSFECYQIKYGDKVLRV